MGGNGNGRGDLPTGPRLAGVPLLGQLFTLKTWLMQLVLTCNCCERPEPILIVGRPGAISDPCPKCGRRFVLQPLSMNADGQLQMNIGATAPDESNRDNKE